MVERQLRKRGISDERVLAAMSEVAREDFVPAEVRERAYRDCALAIGEGQTISQPWIVARMASLLELTGPEKILEVGTGSGYGAAVLSRLCAHVVTVERRGALADDARRSLSAAGARNVEVRVGDGSGGAPDRAPFDAVVVTAAAKDGPPSALLEQLVPGGPLVIPLGRENDEHLVRIRDGTTESIAPVRFVPLVEGEG